MKVKILFIFLLLILFNSCNWITDNPQAKNFHFGDTVTVAFDQTVVNDNENIRLRFSELISEERCPIDLECFWEGNAEVQFEFTADGIKSVFSLNTYSGYTRDTTIASCNIRMIRLDPWPHSSEYLFAEPYRAQVVVSKMKVIRVPPY